MRREDLDPEGDAERWVRIVALPAALAASWLLMSTGPGHFLGRVFCGMWLHELGHAVTAWLCGYHAVPGPWFTPVVENRSWVFGLLVTAVLALLFRAGWRRRSLPMMAGAWTLFLCQLVGSLVLSPARAKALVLFGGDAGNMVLGTLCMTTLYAAADSALRRQRLRFGFLGIGAIAFMDAFVVWWAARTDPDVIPFGENEGQGLTDPTRLVETYGWTEPQLVARYGTVGLVCLAVLVGVYGFALVRRPRE